MISGGVDPKDYQLQPPTFQMGGGNRDFTLPVAEGKGADFSDANWKKVSEFTAAENNKDRNMWYANWGMSLGSQLMNSIFQGVIAFKEFNTRLEIEDRRWDAAERIAEDRARTERDYMRFANEADKRLHGRNGLVERLNRDDNASQERMYDRRLEHQRELAMTQTLDRSFSLRNDYPYGTPMFAG